MKIKLLFLLQIIFIASAFGQTVSEAVLQKMRPKIYEAEQRLKNHLNQELTNRRVMLTSTVILSLNVNRIIKDYNLNPEISQGALPGLDIAPPSSGTLRSFNMSPEEALSYVQEARIILRGRDQIDEAEKVKVENIVKNTLSTLGITNLEIKYAIEELPVQGESMVTPESAANNYQDRILFYVLITAGILILGMIVILVLVMNGMKRLGSGISEQLKQSLGGGLNPERPSLQTRAPTSPKKDGPLPASGHTNPFKEYEEIKEQLRKIFKNWKSDKELLLRFLSTQNRVEFIMIAIDTMENDDREALKKLLGPEVTLKLSSYLKDLNRIMENNPGELTRVAQDLWRLMWLGSQDPTLLSSLSGISGIQQMDEKDLERIMPTLSKEQFSFLMTHADTEKLAIVFMNNPSLMDLSRGLTHQEHLPLLEMDDLLSKIESLMIPQNHKHKKFQQLASHLPREMEAIFKDMLGEPGQSLEDMINARWDVFENFFKTLDVQSSADLLSTLPGEISEKILSLLPEVKVKRIKARPSTVTIEGLRLKKALVDELTR